MGGMLALPPLLETHRPASTSSTHAGTTSLALPYRLSLNSSALSDGSRLISHVATPSDACGNLALAPRHRGPWDTRFRGYDR